MLVWRVHSFAKTFLKAKVEYFEYFYKSGKGKEFYRQPKTIYCRVLNKDSFAPNANGPSKIRYEYTIKIRSDYNKNSKKWELPINKLKSIVIYNGVQLRINDIDSINDIIESPNNATIYLSRYNGEINIAPQKELFPSDNLFPHNDLYPDKNYV